MAFTYTTLPLNFYISVSGCGWSFGFEQKYWWIDGFGEKKARIGWFAHPYSLPSVRELESATFLTFWVVFLWRSLWTWKQNSFKFPVFLEHTNSDVTSFSRQLRDNFPDDMKDKKQRFQHSNISARPRPIRLKLQEMFSLCLMNTLKLKKKSLNFGSFDL